MKLLMISLLFLSNAFSETLCVFAPESNIEIGPEEKTGVAEDDVKKAVEDVKKVYGPIIEKEFDAKLKIVNNWKSSTANAFAKRTKEGGQNVFHVEYLGGLARHKANNLDAVYAVLCHEIGHHIGGSPRKGGRFGANSWASNEGQSDYWATLKCLRRVFKDMNNKEIMKAREELHKSGDMTEEMKVKSPVNKIAKEKCNEKFTKSKEQSLCYRAAMAGYSTARLLKSLGGNVSDKDLPKFETPSSKSVRRTNHNHPAPQCRLDTYFAGAICDVDYLVDVDTDDPNIGACSKLNGDTIGVRPSCWFNPTNGNSGGGAGW